MMFKNPPRHCMRITYSLPAPTGGEARRRLPPTGLSFFVNFTAVAATACIGLATCSFATVIGNFTHLYNFVLLKNLEKNHFEQDNSTLLHNIERDNFSLLDNFK